MKWFFHREAAVYLGLSAQTLYYLNYRGTGPKSSKPGKHRRYRQDDLDQWLEGSRATQ